MKFFLHLRSWFVNDSGENPGLGNRPGFFIPFSRGGLVDRKLMYGEREIEGESRHSRSSRINQTFRSHNHLASGKFSVRLSLSLSLKGITVSGRISCKRRWLRPNKRGHSVVKVRTSKPKHFSMTQEPRKRVRASSLIQIQRKRPLNPVNYWHLDKSLPLVSALETRGPKFFYFAE